MLRVLTLSTLFPDASRPTFGVFVEKQTLALAAHRDVELEVVAPIGIAPWPLGRHPRYRAFADVPDREEWHGLTVHRPRFTSLPLSAGRFAGALLARRLLPLARAIRERFAFDVIDAQFFFPDGPAAMRVANALGVPYSIKARGSDIQIWARRSSTATQVRDAARGAAGLLAVSEALKRDMTALGMPAQKISVHRTGIDRDRFHPLDRDAVRRELGVEGPLLVTVGALIALKGHSLVIDAVRTMPGVTLLLIGDGPERARLQAQIVRSGCTDRIRLLGRKPHDEVARWLAAADVMVLPSMSEGLANVWIESLACGTPIVISDVGGAREVVDRPAAGAVVAREPAAIAEAVSALLANPPDRQAVRAVVDAYSWERNRDSLYEHLRSLRESASDKRVTSNFIE